MSNALILFAVVRHIEPVITRRVVVPAEITLLKLHTVLQIVFDWDNCHLWQFEFGTVDYTCPNPYAEDDFSPPGREQRPAKSVKLDAALGTKKKFSYWYDFGDDWFVDIRVEQRIAADQPVVPVCTEGARAGPPDDCGGVPGYFNLLEILAGPADEERESMVEWLGGEFDPEHVDIADINTELQHVFRPRKPRKPRTPSKTLKSA